MFGWFRKTRPAPVLKISNAAIMYKGIIYSAPIPNRHHDIIKTMIVVSKIPHPFVGMVQGFLTSEGNFVNRKEAYKIAKEAKQLLREHPGGSLFSEEVW